MNQDSADASNLRSYKCIEKSIAGNSTPTTTKKDSQRMRRVRQSGTSPELVIRRACREIGLSYRLSNRDLPGSPDIANRKGKWAIFVHGCFWHQHPGCNKATVPKRNRQYWATKFERNKQRDQTAAEALAGMGYECLIIWECEVGNPRLVKDRLAALIVTK